MTGGLYQRVLGPAWDELHDDVKQFHVPAATMTAAGSFTIRHETGRLARWLTYLARMPAAAEAVPTRLEVTVRGDGERWARRFGEKPLVTTQWPRSDGVLAERFACFELRLRLRVEGGALVYESTGAALRLAFLAIPLFRWLAPRVTAREEPADGPNRVRVTVQVVLPGVGRLISYEGVMQREAG